MNVTIQHTELLASQHSCVIIPGLGAVLAHTVDAGIDSEGTVMPPHRSFTFNTALTAGDGLLENSVARALECSYERARGIIAEEVETMLYQLRKQGTLSLGRIGTLNYDSDNGTVEFVAAPTDMLTPLASWLKPVKADTFIVRQQPVAAARIIRPVPVWRRAARSAAVAAAIIAVAVVTSTPILVDDTHMASTALPAVSAPKTAYVPGTKAPVLNLRATSAQTPVDTAARHAYQLSRKALTGEFADKASSVKEATAPTAAVIATPAQMAQSIGTSSALGINDAHHYLIIVASVGNADEAREYIATAKRRYGGQYQYVEANGRCRIYAATAATSAEARNAAQQLSHRFKGAWVCYR